LSQRHTGHNTEINGGETFVSGLAGEEKEPIRAVQQLAGKRGPAVTEKGKKNYVTLRPELTKSRRKEKTTGPKDFAKKTLQSWANRQKGTENKPNQTQ